MKLTTRLVLLFFLLAFLPAGVVGYLAYLNGRQAIVDNLSTHLMTTSIYKQDEFTRWIASTQEKLVILAQRPLVREYTATLLDSDPAQPEYQQYYNALLDSHLLPNLQDKNFDSFNLIRPADGMILLSTDNGMVGKFRENEPYFVEGQQAPFVDQVRFFPSENRIGMHISAPVLDFEGQLLAVLVGHVNLEIMTHIMQEGRELLVGEETYLVNPAYFFVTEPWLEQVEALKNTVRSRGVTACLEGRTGIDTYQDYRDEIVIGAFRWIPERQLCILTEIDQRVALGPVVALRDQSILLGLISAIVIAVLGYLVAATITRPVNRLMEGARQIGKGNLAYRIDLSKKDEIGELASAFDEMAASLNRTITENERLYQETRDLAQELENRVEKRTAELRSSEEKFRGAFEHAAIGRAIAGIEGQFIKVNRSFCEMLGYDQEEILSMTWQQLTHPDYLAENYRYIEEMIAGRSQSFRMELQLNHKQGAEITVWAKLNVFLVRDEQGRPEYMIGDIEDVTESKLAAQALQASEKRFRRAIMGAPFPIIIHAEDGEVVLINQVWSQLTGYKHNDIPTIADWVKKAYGTELEAVQKDIDHLYGLMENVAEGEYSITTANGDLRIWVFSSAPLGLGPDGRRQVISMAMDVTDRKMVEKAVLEEKTLSDSLINSLPGIFYLFDTQGKFLRWNKNFEKISGYSSEEMTELHPLNLFKGDEKALVQDRIQKVFQEGAAEVEANFVSKDGTSRPYFLTGRRIQRNGQPFLIGIGADISDRIELERTIRDSEERYRLLAESSPDMVFVIDEKGIVQYVNEHAARQFGKSSNQVIGKRHSTLFPPEIAERQELALQQVIKRGAPISAESKVVFPDGPVWLDTKLVPMRSVNGGVMAAMGISRDITGRKLAEESLQKAFDDLARSNAELERFAYVASHDLQEPLRMVTSYLQLLERRLKDKLDDDAREFIDYAVDGSNRMKALINDLLAYSRVGTRGNEFSPTDCENVLDNVLQNLKLFIEESGAEITHDPLPDVMADESQLESLFQNLVGNAIKFKSDKTPKIHIGVKQDKAEWIISVQDNGIGMDPQYYERVFIIFQRLHTRDKYGGTGIGLAISKRIVERHGGRIWIESQPGEGSTFYFTLPVMV